MVFVKVSSLILRAGRELWWWPAICISRFNHLRWCNPAFSIHHLFWTFPPLYNVAVMENRDFLSAHHGKFLSTCVYLKMVIWSAADAKVAKVAASQQQKVFMSKYVLDCAVVQKKMKQKTDHDHLKNRSYTHTHVLMAWCGPFLEHSLLLLKARSDWLTSQSVLPKRIFPETKRDAFKT